MRYCLKFIFLFLFSAGLLSCSVKEKRAACPGYLNVTVMDDGRIATPVGLTGWDMEELFRYELDIETEGNTWKKALRKGQFLFGAYCGLRTAKHEGHNLVIPFGEQCDSLYAYYTKVDLDEQSFVDVSLKKQFATVRVDLNQSSGSMRALNFRVVGNTCGFDLNGFTPVTGAFAYAFQTKNNERMAAFRVPRQVDDSLELEIVSPIGTPLNTIALGQYIALLGYSWKTEELQDIYVSIDFQYALVQITVEGWEDGITLSLIEC